MTSVVADILAGLKRVAQESLYNGLRFFRGRSDDHAYPALDKEILRPAAHAARYNDGGALLM